MSHHYNLDYHRSRSRELLAEARHERLLREVRRAREPRGLAALVAALLRNRSERRGAAAPAACGVQTAK